MIFTTSAVLQLVLSITAVVLVIIAGWKALDIYRSWDSEDQEERYNLEKGAYLTSTAVIIALGIRVFMVPLYFWTMQGFIPSIPGAMCLWGVFNAIPTLAWTDLFIKIALPVIYIGWLIVAYLNSKAGTNSAMKGLMGFFLLASPLVLLDSGLDIGIMLGITPVEVSCCSNAIDVGTRPLPAAIGDISGQTILLIAFLVTSIVYAFILSKANKNRRMLALSMILSAILVVGFTITTTEVLAPWLLDLPFHHCPFCLLFLHPLSIIFTVLYWIGLSAPWLIAIVSSFRGYESMGELGRALNMKMSQLASVAVLASIFMIIVDMVTTL
jgi:hypothetical protein